ncbi:MAG: DUF547 domain-containing protein [Pseudomonadota bacterium]
MKLLLKAVGLFAILLFLPAFGSGERLFAPGSKLWDRWQAHDAGSTKSIDHSAWSALLSTYLAPASSGVAMFDYAGLQASNGDKQALQGYLDTLATVPVSTLNRDEQFAFWVNLYNALTVKVVLDHYPVASIRDIDISPGLFGSGPWGKKLITVEGEDLTLNDIEHRILRPIWNDPRVHYAVNCASIGCPNLKPDAWTAKALDADLDAAARAYVNDPRGVSIVDGKIVVSRIYDWFLEDFGGSEAGVLAHLRVYADALLKADLERIGALSSTDYDWSLNETR